LEYVYRERGYDTLPPGDSPDRLLAAMVAITRMPVSAFEAGFGDVEERLRGHYDGSTVELPLEDADPDDIIVYEKDIYVRPDPLEFDPPVLEQFLGVSPGSRTRR